MFVLLFSYFTPVHQYFSSILVLVFKENVYQWYIDPQVIALSCSNRLREAMCFSCDVIRIRPPAIGRLNVVGGNSRLFIGCVFKSPLLIGQARSYLIGSFLHHGRFETGVGRKPLPATKKKACEFL